MNINVIILCDFAQIFHIVILSHIYVYNICKKNTLLIKYSCYSTTSPNSNLKNKAGIILYFCIANESHEKTQTNSELVRLLTLLDFPTPSSFVPGEDKS